MEMGMGAWSLALTRMVVKGMAASWEGIRSLESYLWCCIISRLEDYCKSLAMR